jgi:Secretion system C-terminal sorting domain
MKKNFYYSFLLMLSSVFLCINSTYAEGSRDLNLSTSIDAYRVMLSYAKPVTGSTSSVGWYRITALDSLEARNSFFVYAKEGEQIAVASSALGIGTTGAIKLYSYTGSLLFHWTAPGSLGEGRMPAGAGSKRIENQGPNGLDSGGLGGYRPLIYTVPTGGTGIYRVEFISPDETNGSTSSYSVSGLMPRANADFVQQTTNVLIAAFDVSIISGGALIKGRMFTEFMSLTGGELRRSSGPLRYYFTENYTVYILNHQGYKYEMSVNGLAPYGYFLYADDVGMQLNDGVTPAYESTSYSPTRPNNRRIFRTEEPETDFEHHHKIFMNMPDPTMPDSATRNGVKSWLLTPLNPASYSYTLTYVLQQIPNPYSGWFRFNFPTNGTRYRVFIDLNGDGVFGNGNDVILSGTTTSGVNYLWWDGLDGAGVAVPTSVCVAAKIEFISGEIHLPLADAEMFRKGIQIKRLNGGGTVPNYNIHWNDLPLNDNTNIYGTYVKKTPAYGTSSFGFTHRWEVNETGVANYFDSTHRILYGDNRFMDNWAYDTSNVKTYLAFICGSLLNTKFVHFSIHNKMLLWEIDNTSRGKFDIEYSADGIYFTSIWQTTCVDALLKYSFTASSLNTGFYRIKYTSTANKITYSEIIKTTSATNSGITIYPNPAKDYIDIKGVTGTYMNIQITNSCGELVVTEKNIANSRLSVKKLPSGTYFVKINDAQNNLLKTLKFQIVN